MLNYAYSCFCIGVCTTINKFIVIVIKLCLIKIKAIGVGICSTVDDKLIAAA